MINAYSAVQQQFPLSPRKFWKKIIAKSTLWIIILILLGIALGLIVIFAPSKSPDIVWTVIFVLLGLLTIFVIFVLLPYSIYIHAYIKRYYYDCGESFVTIKKGVFSVAEIHVQYPKIQDVYVDQDFLDRILGLYDVHISSATATSGMEAHIDGVEQPAAEGLKSLLLGKIQTQNNITALPSIPVPQPPAQNSLNSQATSPIANQLESVSSKDFPIESRWILIRSMGNLIHLIYLVFIFWLWIYSAIQIHSVGTFLLIYIVALVVVTIISMIGLFIWKANYWFEFDPEYITLRTGIIAKQERHVPYKTIQDVNMSQSMFERFFGLATVSIENAAGIAGTGKSRALTIPGQTVERANKLVAITNDYTKNIKPSAQGL